MPIRVQLPDGTIGEFPDGMKDADIEAVLQKQYGAPQQTRPAGLPPGVPMPGLPAHAPVTMSAPSTPASRLLGSGNIGDTAHLAASHLKNLVTGPYHAFADPPKDAYEQGVKGTPATSGPMNLLGQFGLGAERMLVAPTRDALKKLPSAQNATDVANDLADAVPVAGPLARSIENDAQAHGALPALLGGAIDVGAPEVAGGVFGKLKNAAPGLAESAMNIRPTARGYGKTPGAAILNETSGIRPETIQNQSQAALNTLTPKIESMAAKYPGTIDITPARQTVADAIDTQRARNNPAGRDALAPVADQLQTNADNGLALSPDQTATGTLNLKRGLRDAFVKNWSPDAASALTRDTAKSASGVLDNQLDSALGPDFASTNQRISSLIPVTDAADKLTRADPLSQRLAGKLKAHTGALTSAVAGAAAGGHSGGLLGAIGGGALGFALPEFMGAPATTMAMARGFNSPIPSTLIPPLFAGGILTPKRTNP